MCADGQQPAGSLGGSVRTQWELGRSETFCQRAVVVVEGTAAGHPAAPPGAQTALVWVRRAAGTAAANGKGRSDGEFQSTVIELLLCFYHAKPPELHF